MRDTRPTNTERGTADLTLGKKWLLVLVTLAVAIGLTITATGAMVGASEHQPTEHEALAVSTDCEDDANHLSIENPNGDAVGLGLTWNGDHSSLEIHSDGTLETSMQTERTVETDDAGDRTETATYSLATELPANENVTFVGLADGTYELSATADDDDVSLDHTEVTLECADDSEDVLVTLVVGDYVDEKHDETEMTTAVSLETDDKADGDEKKADADREKKEDKDDGKTIVDILTEEPLVNQPAEKDKAEKLDEKKDDRDDEKLDEKKDDRDDEKLDEKKDDRDDEKLDEKKDDRDDEKHDEKKADRDDEKSIIDILTEEPLVNQPAEKDDAEKDDEKKDERDDDKHDEKKADRDDDK
ncbi:hypothetical protein [Natrarchaeobius oligotrophus]|uniref:hypothetical protein n=1 Tax=Natrarchaeobius oligotrophus TaxID=3455743 RepID=UPI001404B0D1|nr:hypothetical protein [Natrarchaeobius chitinivorans]